MRSFGVGALMCVGSALVLVAQQVTASQRIDQFENADVKVWKAVVLPNAPLTMHRHDHPRIIVALRGGTMRLGDNKGGFEDHPWETGKAYWLPAMPPGAMHEDVNPGKEPIEIMAIELEKEK